MQSCGSMAAQTTQHQSMAMTTRAIELIGESGACIQPHLYVGDKRLAANLDALQEVGITHIVNCTIDIRNYFERNDEERTGQQTIKYLRCPVHDTDLADLSPHFDTAYQFIDTAIREGHSVLVHCQQGISRSATITIAYLMRSRQLSLSDAYLLLRTHRHIARPKPNFLRQLMKYSNEIQQKPVTSTSSTVKDASPTATSSESTIGVATASSPTPSTSDASTSTSVSSRPTPSSTTKKRSLEVTSSDSSVASTSTDSHAISTGVSPVFDSSMTITPAVNESSVDVDANATDSQTRPIKRLKSTTSTTGTPIPDPTTALNISPTTMPTRSPIACHSSVASISSSHPSAPKSSDATSTASSSRTHPKPTTNGSKVQVQPSISLGLNYDSD